MLTQFFKEPLADGNIRQLGIDRPVVGPDGTIGVAVNELIIIYILAIHKKTIMLY